MFGVWSRCNGGSWGLDCSMYSKVHTKYVPKALAAQVPQVRSGGSSPYVSLSARSTHLCED